MYDRHRVLQLITETEGAGRLIESRACPHATRQDLIEEPPVGQKVDSGVGSFAVYRAEGVVPVVPHALKGLLGARGTAEPMNELTRFFLTSGGSEDEKNLPLLP